MAQIQFDDIDGEIHVYALFTSGVEIIGFGDTAFASVLNQIEDGNHFEIRSIYDNIRSSDLADYTITFNIEEEDSGSVVDFKAIVAGREHYMGCYFVFAEGGGADGLIPRSNMPSRDDA